MVVPRVWQRNIDEAEGRQFTYQILSGWWISFLFFFQLTSWVVPFVIMFLTVCLPQSEGFTKALIGVYGAIGALLLVRSLFKNLTIRMRDGYDEAMHITSQMIVSCSLGVIGGSILLYSYVGNNVSVGLSLLSLGGPILGLCITFSFYGSAYHRLHNFLLLPHEEAGAPETPGITQRAQKVYKALPKSRGDVW